MGGTQASATPPSSLLLLQYVSIEDVAQDLDMVVQSTSDGEWIWEAASQSEQDSWESLIRDPLSVTSPSQISGLAGRVQVVEGINLTYSLRSVSADTEGDDGLKATVDVSAPTLSPNSAAKIKQSLLERSQEWKDEAIESLFLFDLLTTAQTLAADLAPASDTTGVETGPEPKPVGPTIATDIRLSRAIFWSHHLKAPSKLKDFNNWCPELGIWGIVRVGWPGYLCFEGESSAVDEMVRRVKGLQWHAIQLRVEKSWTWTSGKQAKGRTPSEQALLDCGLSKDHPDNAADQEGEAKVRTGCQVIESLGDLVTRLRGCELDEDEIEGALGIRMSGSGR
ncbi:hypothetical protein PHSY_003051 [Pseudozyma hubeiensis SY62]|uniref:Uncharacterized protein n=1 Tax=Pseudozyma hubeiensis (strain SY62) TaxID=1305764 RepID=R9PBM5_PSEHS|nr:hypothetical protein PHSY_003051 [Pseudozyma hubeiensis SY62]GAC95475.1 hypothetical protein PHSY_003051 [Pseudozyma hubeiensis SY62]